jgi:hypothetical protein
MPWETISPDERKFKHTGIEPDIEWNLGPGSVDFYPYGEAQNWIPVLLWLDGISPRDFADGKALFDQGDAISLWRTSVRVPRLYTETPQFEGFQFITALVTKQFFELLDKESANALGQVVRQVTISPPLTQESIGTEPKAELRSESVLAPSGPPAPDTVVVGIIDDGIAFAHERFREPGGSRVEFFWMQDGPPPGPLGLFPSGLELRKPDLFGARGIDGLLSDCTFAGLVDEDELYRRAGVADFRRRGHKAIAWQRAHGTHVLDLACGFDAQSPPNWRIIGVQLPIATTGLPVSSTLAAHVIEGVYYILVRSLAVAARLNCAPLPVVINISYGITAGPHDGTHIVEWAIDHIVASWRLLFGAEVRVVIAAGNSHLDRLHAQVEFATKHDTIDLPWRVLPDDHTPSVVEVWLPHAPKPPPSRLKLSVIPPGAGSAPALPEIPGAVMRWIENGDVLCEVSYFYYGPPMGRGMFFITIQPTARVDPVGPVGPSGLWQIRLENDDLTSTQTVHARVRRDQAPFGYPSRGRQSFFDDPAYVRYDNAGRAPEADTPGTIVKRAGAQNAMATGVEPVVIGGLLRKEKRAAKYSAGGPITPRGGVLPAHRRGPDALTVSDDSIVHAGVLAAGTRSGSVVAMNGTSVAAPTIAREVAKALSSAKSGDRAAVRALATSHELGLPPLTRPQPDRGGAGRIILPSLHPLARFE